jgi:hypothetical protein
LSTLRLVIDPSNDLITVGVDTVDSSRPNQALLKIEQVNTSIDAAMVQRDPLVAHWRT